jgi:hypothetical protein
MLRETDNSQRRFSYEACTEEARPMLRLMTLSDRLLGLCAVTSLDSEELKSPFTEIVIAAVRFAQEAPRIVAFSSEQDTQRSMACDDESRSSSAGLISRIQYNVDICQSPRGAGLRHALFNAVE